eukprot:1160121-Pelagomonas_calceolata.AAC.12
MGAHPSCPATSNDTPPTPWWRWGPHHPGVLKMALPMAWTMKRLMACPMGRQVCLWDGLRVCMCALCVHENGAANGVDRKIPDGLFNGTAAVS